MGSGRTGWDVMWGSVGLGGGGMTGADVAAVCCSVLRSGRFIPRI